MCGFASIPTSRPKFKFNNLRKTCPFSVQSVFWPCLNSRTKSWRRSFAAATAEIAKLDVQKTPKAGNSRKAA